MVRAGSRIAMGATLFTTPGLKGGTSIPGLEILLFVVLAAVIGLMLSRHGGPRTGPSDPDPDEGGGSGPRPPDPRPDRPPGGIPLDDAAPARMRLRSDRRLADRLPGRERRPAHRPERAPVRDAVT